MIKHFVFCTASKVNKLTNQRDGEVKLGESLRTFDPPKNLNSFLKTAQETFVIFGIAEDIGVMLNGGEKGTSNAWNAFLQRFLNLQSNAHVPATQILVLGNFDFKEEIIAISKEIHREKQHQAFSQLMDTIDKEIAHLSMEIVRAGKIPVVIGGGHNNAYGLLKGTALAKGKPMNVVNFDAHTDFRALEGRHSGNGFSYAMNEGFLDRYFIFGLHEDYTSQSVFDSLHAKKNRIQYATYEAMNVRRALSFKEELLRAKEFVGRQWFGIEIDCDALENIESSAATPSGFSVEKGRRFVHMLANHPKVAYFHIAEAAPKLDDPASMRRIGKLLSYLVMDFIRAKTVKS